MKYSTFFSILIINFSFPVVALAELDYKKNFYDHGILLAQQKSCNAFMKENQNHAVAENYNQMVDLYLKLDTEKIVNDKKNIDGTDIAVTLAKRNRIINESTHHRRVRINATLHERESVGYMNHFCNNIIEFCERNLLRLKPELFEATDYCDHDGWDTRYGEGVPCE